MSGDGRVEDPGFVRLRKGCSVTPIQLVKDVRVWKAAVYFPLSFGLGLFWFVALVGGVPLATVSTLLWVGLLLFAVLFMLLRGGSMLDRRLTRLVFEEEIADPYRPVEAGTLLGRVRIMITDPATWKDLAFQVVRAPLSFAYFCVSAVGWAFVAVCLSIPFIAQLTKPEDKPQMFGRTVENWWEGAMFVPAGLLGFVAMLYVIKGMSLAHVALSKALLGPSEKQRLRASAAALNERAAHLQASRGRAVDAAEAERRRIERDLHDGAQQQLLAVAMDIGRARTKLDNDPEAARALIEQAHTGARAAISELRDLARGIYPAILTDRGLSSALSALAARSPVPVSIQADLPERPPAVVESIAYFTVAEALTNVAKYAEATHVAVEVTRDGDQVIVQVRDDGRGGARISPGGGLAGLADRAATIDGTLTVTSPPGGPTILTVSLPCSW